MYRNYTSPGGKRCQSSGLGRGIPRQSRIGQLEYSCVIPNAQRTRHIGQINGHKSFREIVNRINSPDTHRQCLSHGVFQSSESEPQIIRVSDINMGRGHRLWDFTALRSYCGENEYSRRRLVQNSGQTQLDVASSNFSVYRYSVRQAYNRPVCELPKHPAPKVQQSILGTSFRGGSGTEQLGARKQLRECSMLFDTSGARSNTVAKSIYNSNSPILESSNVVSRSFDNVHCASVTDSEQSAGISGHGAGARTVQKSDMECICLEVLWRKSLIHKGWSIESVNRLQFCLAKGTLKSYINALAKCARFCSKSQCRLPPESTALLADFLREISDGFDIPNSELRTTLAALGHLYALVGPLETFNSSEIKLLVTCLVKSGNASPMCRSKVMPIQNFHSLFLSWP
ncbi:hypothetical protein DPMN_118962 [Dreissena polymorpha]|uniref:Uncharacterized protein n=1 Tax=Dreissena polymorpha TaxID=45954 RepID=A0A9D4GP23_DREPO|nr:hypothetical protein DPMN_118962 [Dreissena polymorpha]